MTLPTLPILEEGARIYWCGIQRKAKGWKRYSGDYRAICSQIVKECWNGQYFQTSAGHFRQFYARDFGWCIAGLLKQKYHEKCNTTMRFALQRYASYGRITTCITPGGQPFDFPNVYSPDSVAYFFRSLLLLNNKELIEQYHSFLQREVDRFFATAVDPKTGLAQRKIHFSGMKDYAVRDASCYDSTAIGLMQAVLKKLMMFENPLKHYNMKKALLDRYWTGSYFRDDLSGSDFVSGDANVYPFLFGILEDTTKLKSAIARMHEVGLATPFPLRYEPAGALTNHLWHEWLVPHWQRSCHWSSIGLDYISLLGKISKKQQTQALYRYRDLVEKHDTLFECYRSDGTPYSSAWYHADEAMLWAVKLLL